MKNIHDQNFYRMMFGENTNADTVLKALNLSRDDIERYRDAYVIHYTGDYRAGWYLCVTTRTGGNNREDYANEALTRHPRYQFDEDDEFDSTYAHFYFSVPEEPSQP